MKKTKVKALAKINLTLDVVGVEKGFHQLKTLVASIDLGDQITLSARQDKAVTLTCNGLDVGCDLESNNAYKTAKLFMQTFNVNGVDICLQKNIPVGAGLGGSSADIAGVLVGMQKLYNVNAPLCDLANALGSDSAYMINGGWAVLQGKGDIITPLSVNTKLYLLILSAQGQVSAGACYKAFDSQNIIYPSVTDKAVELLAKGDIKEFGKVIKNDLYPSAKQILPQIESNLNALKEFGDCVMTGSGSAVFGIYKSARARNNAYNQLVKRFGDKLIKAQTV